MKSNGRSESSRSSGSGLRELLDSPGVGRFLRFCITGGLNTAVDFAIYTLLISAFGWSLYLAQVAGYSGGMICSYTVNRRWTFQTKEQFFGRELLRFVAVNLLVMTLSLGVLHLFDKVLGLHFLLAKLCTVAFTMVLGFVLNRFFVFAAEEKTPPRH